ncbi:hypothetical protein [Virgibacillus doumboii]|nr:hypothetical protein [Virgibacillus doumboii]
MGKAVFYHAGCPVCMDAEKMMMGYLDQSKVDLEIVDFNNDASRFNSH